MNPTIAKPTEMMGKGIFLCCLIAFLYLLPACTSRGVAPVYNRTPSAAVPKSTNRPGHYKVKSGDTLYSIAWRYRVDYHLLARWNRIKAPKYPIYQGQWLRLHPPSTSRPAGQKKKRTIKIPAKPKKTSPVAAIKPQPTVPSSNKTKPSKEGIEKLKLFWRWPTNGKVVQTYSSKDPARKGIRVSGSSGQSVVAAESGKVVYSGSGLVGYGNLIIIKHNKKYLSAYGYNKKLLVKEGDKVLKGERIALMGAPRNGTDPVLHFEIRKQGVPQNPLSLLPRKQ